MGSSLKYRAEIKENKNSLIQISRLLQDLSWLYLTTAIEVVKIVKNCRIHLSSWKLLKAVQHQCKSYGKQSIPVCVCVCVCDGWVNGWKVDLKVVLKTEIKWDNLNVKMLI